MTDFQDVDAAEVKKEFDIEPKLFGKWEFTEVKGEDDSLTNVITISPRWVSHTSGRWQKKRFRKVECPITERFINCMMMHGRNSGKKLLAYNTLRQALEIIHVMTERNPIQVLLDAIQKGGPREDSTRVGSAGVVRRQAVDVSPLRRVNHAMQLIVSGARRNAFRNIKSFAECLADEIILCSEESPNSYAIKKKTEVERVAESNR